MIACNVLQIPAGASGDFFMKESSEKTENSSTRGTPRRQRIPGRASPGSVAPNISFVKEIVPAALLSPGKWGDFLMVKTGVWLPVTG